MLHTTASCGHPTVAVGSPGSKARTVCEAEPCSRCVGELPRRRVTGRMLEALAELGDPAPCCQRCGLLLAAGDLIDVYFPFKSVANLHAACATADDVVPAADEVFVGRRKKLS